MRTFALIEDEKATMLHVRSDGDVTVFDRNRGRINFRIAMHINGDTTWLLLSRVIDGVVRAEDRLIRIDRLVERVKSGWRPVADEIDSEIPHRTLSLANFAVDLIAFPAGIASVGEQTPRSLNFSYRRSYQRPRQSPTRAIGPWPSIDHYQ